MSGVSNAAEDDQATVVRPRLACAVHAPPTSASVATPAKPWHDGAGAAGALQGPSAHSTLLLVALSRGTVTGADPLWTYTEEGAAAFYPLAVVPLARGAERPQGQREI